MADVEVWRNNAKGMVGVQRFGGGREPRTEIVYGSGVVRLSPDERRAHSMACASADVDPFRNGTFTRVDTVADGDDLDALDAMAERNPNTFTDDEIRDLMSGPDATELEARLVGVTNVVVAKRLLAVAGEVDASARKRDMVEAKVAELSENPLPNRSELVPEDDLASPAVGHDDRPQPLPVDADEAADDVDDVDDVDDAVDEDGPPEPPDAVESEQGALDERAAGNDRDAEFGSMGLSAGE